MVVWHDYLASVIDNSQWITWKMKGSFIPLVESLQQVQYFNVLTWFIYKVCKINKLISKLICT